MRVEDIKAYLEWKKDTSKPHPWFVKVVDKNAKRNDKG